MKGMILAVCILACLLVGSGCMTGGYTSTDRAIPSEADSLAMSKHDVIAMSHAKVGDDVIIKMIQTTGSYFQLKSRDVVELADSGVSDKVIAAMLGTSEAPEEHGTRYYNAPYYGGYYPPYWYGGYPYYYPWGFGFSVGYYAPYHYHRGYIGPRYRTPLYRYSGSSYGNHFSSGHSYSGGRSAGVGRSSGRRR